MAIKTNLLYDISATVNAWNWSDHTKWKTEYRSVIFDVAHYRPFRFAAQVKVYDESGSNPTTVPSSENLLSNKTHGSQEGA